jgi:hypothetical protein
MADEMDFLSVNSRGVSISTDNVSVGGDSVINDG